ncbi:nucleoside-diphosphate sugar epimerase/dehydratase [Echinicola sediminis]
MFATNVFANLLIEEVAGVTGFFPFPILVTALLISLFALTLSRVLIKGVYAYYMNQRLPVKNIVIFGAGEAGRLTKNVMKRSGVVRQKVHAFLDDDPLKEGRHINGVPVYLGLSELKCLVKDNGVTDLLISVMSISPKRKREIIDECLNLGIKTSIVPSIDEWVKGGFNVRKIRKIRIEDLLSRPEINLDNPRVAHQIRDKVVLVTGAAGSIGSELCKQIIINNPKQLILLDQAESALFNLEQDFKTAAWGTTIKPLLADIRDKKRMTEIFKTFQPDIVYHAAAYKHVPMMETYPEEAVRSNILATKYLADLAVINNVNTFVFVSTDKAVNPTNVMGASKRIAELYVQSLSGYLDERLGATTKFAITRFGNVLGSNGSVIPLFKKQIEKGGPVYVTDPDITRYFMTISEACSLILEAGTMAKGKEIFIFDMGEPVRILDLAKKMILLNGKKLETDIKIEFTGLREGEKMHEELIGSSEELEVTYHPKIRVVKMAPFGYSKLNYQIEFFEKLLMENSDSDIVRHIKNIVPEYISNTSRFVVLDHLN